MFKSKGFLRLYDANGREVNADWDDLLCMESGSAEDAICRRVFGRNSGYYFLVSDRPNFIAQLLALYVTPNNIFPYPFGIANRPQWSFDLAVRSLHEVGVQVPELVCQMARQHVKFRAGSILVGRRKAQIVRMRCACDVQRELDSRVDKIALVQLAEYAQGQDGIVDYSIFRMALTSYCQAAGITRESDVTYLAAQLTIKNR